MYNYSLFSPTSLIFAASIIVLLYCYLSCKANFWKRRGINGPKSYPLIGTLWENVLFANNVLDEKRYKKYGRIFGVMEGLTPVLVIGEPELIKQIMITDFRAFVNHKPFFSAKSLFSFSLVELNGDEWKRMRSILSPVFSTGKLKAMLPMIDHCTENSLEYLKTVAIEEKEVELKKVMMYYTLDIISSCVFSIETNVSKNPDTEFVRKTTDIITPRIWRVITSQTLPAKLQKLLNLQLVDDALIDYFTKLVKTVIDHRRSTKIESNDFIKLLLDAELSKDECKVSSSELNSKKRLTEIEITAQCLLFLLVGYETTSTLLNFTLYALAMNPEKQKILHNEINNYMTDHETLDYDSLLALPYLDAVINESLRLYSPTPMFQHVCSEEYKLGDTGITVENGTVISLPFYAIHRDPSFFTSPNEFKPERFLPENRDQLIPYSFIPFGVGPRICIGMRFTSVITKYFLAKLVHKIEVFKTENTAKDPQFNGVTIELSCKPLLAAFRMRM